MDSSILFEPLQIGRHTLRNRIVMPPMVVARGTGTPDACAWYGRHAQGGVSLVIVEATDSRYFGERFGVAELTNLVEAIHQGGALAAIQLFPGIRGASTKPADMTLADIETLKQEYDRAARMCKEAGFDGIEPHGAHGFLLNQFFSPEQNQRTDAYGGDLQGRMRLALEIVETVKPICGDDMLLFYRHTPVGPGYGIEESLELAHALVKAGVQVLDLSPSSIEAPGDRAEPFMGLGVPIITVNDLEDPARAVEVLREGRADLVAVGRQLIADPDWLIKVQSGRQDEIVTCIKCDHCFVDLREGRYVGCTQWTEA